MSAIKTNNRNVSRFSSGAKVEALETRKLLSATLTDTGVLVVRGTPYSDVISVDLTPDQQYVRTDVNGVVDYFDANSVAQVSVRSRRGDDVVDVAPTFPIDTLIRGGTGNDTLFAGAGRDTVATGTGDSVVYPGTGDDVIDCGSGNDTVYAGPGNDTIWGGSGNDELHAGGGSNYVDGGSGDSVLLASTGNDTLDAGTGNSTVYGGSGSDVLIGTGGGYDSLVGGQGDMEFHVAVGLTSFSATGPFNTFFDEAGNQFFA